MTSLQLQHLCICNIQPPQGICESNAADQAVLAAPKDSWPSILAAHALGPINHRSAMVILRQGSPSPQRCCGTATYIRNSSTFPAVSHPASAQQQPWFTAADRHLQRPASRQGHRTVTMAADAEQQGAAADYEFVALAHDLAEAAAGVTRKFFRCQALTLQDLHAEWHFMV